MRGGSFFLVLLLNAVFTFPALAAPDKCFPWGTDDSYADVLSVPVVLLNNNLDVSTRYVEAFISKASFPVRWGRNLVEIDQQDVELKKEEFYRVQLELLSSKNPKVSAEAKKNIESFDLNRDGMVSANEVKSYQRSNASYHSQWTHMADYLALDPNQDGRITIEELAIMARKAFHTVDANQDCYLSNDELDVARQVLVEKEKTEKSK
ncbi:MAG TPA: hypothetical protein PLX33_00510 [Alphaproteobacteria bacterium]|nr:hypothetical protein [Alphaproteobacteria bacterium]